MAVSWSPAAPAAGAPDDGPARPPRSARHPTWRRISAQPVRRARAGQSGHGDVSAVGTLGAGPWISGVARARQLSGGLFAASATGAGRRACGGPGFLHARSPLARENPGPGGMKATDNGGPASRAPTPGRTGAPPQGRAGLGRGHCDLGARGRATDPTGASLGISPQGTGRAFGACGVKGAPGAFERHRGSTTAPSRPTLRFSAPLPPSEKPVVRCLRDPARRGRRRAGRDRGSGGPPPPRRGRARPRVPAHRSSSTADAGVLTATGQPSPAPSLRTSTRTSAARSGPAHLCAPEWWCSPEAGRRAPATGRPRTRCVADARGSGDPGSSRAQRSGSGPG